MCGVPARHMVPGGLVPAWLPGRGREECLGGERVLGVWCFNAIPSRLQLSVG